MNHPRYIIYIKSLFIVFLDKMIVMNVFGNNKYMNICGGYYFGIARTESFMLGFGFSVPKKMTIYFEPLDCSWPLNGKRPQYFMRTNVKRPRSCSTDTYCNYRGVAEWIWMDYTWTLISKSGLSRWSNCKDKLINIISIKLFIWLWCYYKYIFLKLYCVAI